ncbi:MAG: tryptophan-rich sensory protein [Gemmatimonadales bacterium]|nr:tryptophan-rich sensory protein [Gemmatimonadales bacterium]
MTRMLALAGWILLSFLAATIGGLASPGQWYERVNKPSWNPPNAVFAPVWTVLFILMGVAAWLVWLRRGETGVTLALALFVGQLVLNVLWSWLFFHWHRMDLAFYELLLFWVVILATLVAFWQVRPLAGWLFVPYLVWVTFAGYLNLTLWRLNR